MIRGHIEAVSPTAVSGWLFAEGRALKDTPVLAFSGPDCVGAGQISLFRQDLFDAGMGDGYLGFEIPIAGDRVNDPASVVVRLDGSDACLIQPAARVVSAAAASGLLDEAEVLRTNEMHRWMLAQGWIDQADYDFLKAMWTRGVYEYALPRQLRVPGRTLDALNEAARHRFAVLNRQDIRLVHRLLDGAQGLSEVIATLRQPGSDVHPVFALCGGSFRTEVREAGHCRQALPPDQVPLVAHTARPWQMLFIDARCATDTLELIDGDQITLMLAQTSPR